MAYEKQLIDHFENPRNVGTLDKNDSDVGTGLVGAPACGDVMRLQIKVNEEGIIEDAKFKTFGCGSAIASSSLVTMWVKSKTVEEAEKITNQEIVKELFADNKNIYDGVKNVANGKELTSQEQLFVLMSLKLYEISFLALMDSGKMDELMQKGTMTMPPMGDSPEVA